MKFNGMFGDMQVFGDTQSLMPPAYRFIAFTGSIHSHNKTLTATTAALASSIMSAILLDRACNEDIF
jgi:hypothetical protein